MNSLTTAFFIAAAMILFAGCYMLVRSHNMIRLVIAVEVVMKAVTLVLVFAGYSNGNTALSQSFIITIIVAEVVVAVVATGIAIAVYRNNGDLDLRKLNKLNG